MKFLRHVFTFFASFILISRLGAVDLAPELDDQGAFWNGDAEAFIAAHRTTFYWITETDRSAAAHYASRMPEPLLFAGQVAGEGTIRFAAGKPAEIKFVLFNRGDDGAQYGREKFEGQIKEVGEAVSTWAGNRGKPGPVQKVTDKAWIRQHLWQKGPHQVVLSWNSSAGGDRTFRAEYINLTVTPVANGDALQVKGAARRGSLKGNVKTEDAGDVRIDGIPMVDQGDRGYCAVAVTERILRYYGSDVGQHVIAQLANSSAGGGTDMDAMFANLKKASSRLGIVVRELIPQDGRGLIKRLERYNSYAKRANARGVYIPRSGMINLSDLYDQLDADTYLAFLKDKEKSDINKFSATIRRAVPEGVPLVWCVYLGLFPETPKVSGRGGHARLIIGFNEKTQEILYTDTWGAGHELKRLPLDQALAMTTALFQFAPSSNR